ncbi:MAG: diaminopimelate decarboxylase [Oscillospiraceae bacterium]|nr:diaminopimelate decarboxylase [Oscillospiraceae bacterium]
MLSSNITRDADGTLRFAGQSVPALAEEYATPLYLMDEDRIRANCRMYRQALRESFGEDALPLYASKACAFKQMYRIMAEEGMGVDTVSSGEIHTALAAGFPAERIWFHGDGKTDADIRYAVGQGVGCFIVDNETELLALAQEVRRQGVRQRILLRVTPGIDPHTFEAVNTGTVDVKFGVAIQTGAALEFARLALAQEGLELEGIHCHVGSMVFDENVFEDSAEIMLGFMAEMKEKLGFEARVLNLGGGYGVRYRETDKQVDIPARIAALAAFIKERCAALGLALPAVLMEPGRSIVADAGMTVYTVSTVKHIPNCKNYVIVDGGMTDNPRWCLYRAAYTVLHAERGGETERFTLAGRCCESGDIVQPDVPLPADIKRGETVAVCTTGAYNYAMSSNYNRLGRPPVVMLRGGESYVAVRRERAEDLCALDV